MDSIKVKMFFSRGSIINLLLEDNETYYDQLKLFKSYSDNKLIQLAGRKYINNINENKIYCFTDTGEIIEQKTLINFKRKYED